MLNTSNQFEHSGGNKFFCTESGKLANGCRDLVASEIVFVSICAVHFASHRWRQSTVYMLDGTDHGVDGRLQAASVHTNKVNNLIFLVEPSQRG